MNTRVNVYFPPAVYQELETLSEEKGMSKPGFIKHIFELYKVFVANKTLTLTDSAARNVILAHKEYRQGKTRSFNSVPELMAEIS